MPDDVHNLRLRTIRQNPGHDVLVQVHFENRICLLHLALISDPPWQGPFTVPKTWLQEADDAPTRCVRHQRRKTQSACNGIYVTLGVPERMIAHSDMAARPADDVVPFIVYCDIEGSPSVFPDLR
jgi:hypothetical protein